MKPHTFYESYWNQENAPPHLDPTTSDRMARLEKALRSSLHQPEPRRLHVLDAGCGDGVFAAFLHGLGFQVTGVDLSATAIERARARSPDVDLRLASLEEPLPFPDATFDAVWCTEVLEHVFSVHDTLAELNRVLKDRGTLLLTTPYHGLVKNVLIALLKFDQHFNPDISHIRFFTRPTLERCLSRAGFVPLSWGGVGRIWPMWKSFFVTAQKGGPPGHRPQIIG